MSISVITGVPGAGKTAVLTAIARDLIKKGDVDVYSNYKIFYKSERLKFWRKMDDLLKITQGVILMDEIQIYLNSRFYAKMSIDMQYKLQQHRKEGLHIVGTVQKMSRIDVTMRELVTNYYECGKVLRLPFFGMLYRITEYDPDDWDVRKTDMSGKPIVRKAIRIKYYWGSERKEERPLELPRNIKDVYGMYDTLGKIELPEDSNVRKGDTMS